MYIALMMGIIAPLLPICCAIGIYYFGFGVFWCWSVLTLIVLAYCATFLLRYRSKVWESMRMIEQELL